MTLRVKDKNIKRTIPSSCTLPNGISPSKSITLLIEAGMASCEGWAGVSAAEGAGSDAASAAAIEVAIFVDFLCSAES